MLNCRIHLEPKATSEELIASFKEDTFSGLTHIGLVSMYAPHYYQNIVLNGFADVVKATTSIRFTPEDRILAKTLRGKPQLG